MKKLFGIMALVAIAATAGWNSRVKIKWNYQNWHLLMWKLWLSTNGPQTDGFALDLVKTIILLSFLLIHVVWIVIPVQQ